MSSTAPADPTAPYPESEAGEGHLRRAHGLPSLVLFGLVYMVPLTVFTTYGIVTEITGGRLSVAYLVTLAAMVFTARSYARMAAAYPVAGSAYTYSQRSFGAPIGFLAGWSLLLDYLFLPMLNYLVIGIYLNAAIPAIPPWVIIVVTITSHCFRQSRTGGRRCAITCCSDYDSIGERGDVAGARSLGERDELVLFSIGASRRLQHKGRFHTGDINGIGAITGDDR